MAGIGAAHLMVGKILDEEPGKPIGYDTPRELGPLIETTVNLEYRDNALWGSNAQRENDAGISGGTINLNLTSMTMANEAYLFGFKSLGEGKGYAMTDQAAPYMGYGYVQTVLIDKKLKYYAYFFKKAQFTLGQRFARTKEQNINYQTPTANGRIYAADDGSEGNAQFELHNEFEKNEDALKWVSSCFTPATTPENAEA